MSNVCLSAQQSDGGQPGCPPYRKGPGGLLRGGGRRAGREWRTHAGKTQGGTKDVSVCLPSNRDVNESHSLLSPGRCSVSQSVLFNLHAFLHFSMLKAKAVCSLKN